MSDSVDKISDNIIKMVEDKIGGYPCLVQTPFYTEDAVKNILKDSTEMWFNQFIDGKTVHRIEGLIDYRGSGIYVYYNTKADKKYRFVFMSDNTKRDSIAMTLQTLDSYKVKEVWN